MVQPPKASDVTCPTCGQRFDSVEAWQRHNLTHMVRRPPAAHQPDEKTKG
jgi:hypothetical protein